MGEGWLKGELKAFAGWQPIVIISRQKIPRWSHQMTGQDAIGWVVGLVFCLYWVRDLASLDLEVHGNSCYGAQSVSEIFVL